MPLIDKMRPEVTPQALELYKARLAQIAFIKKQQWIVTNYAVAIYAAIVWVGKNVETISAGLRWLVSSVILTGVCAVGLLIKFQWDLMKERERADKATAYCFTKDQRITLDLPDYQHSFLRGCEVVAALIIVCLVGAAVVVWILLNLKTAISWDNSSNPY